MSPLEPDFIEAIKHKLVERQREISSVMKNHREQIGHEAPKDFIDAASQKEEENLISHEGLIEEAEINLIEDAMERIQEGLYGLCADCSSTIPQERLLALPHAKYCVPCQEKREKSRRR